MKKILLSISTLFFFVGFGFAQTITVAEPEFVNTSLYVKNDKSVKLEKAIPHEYSRPTAGSILIGGYGRVRFNQVKGSASTTRIAAADNSYTFIVRTYNNEIDPVDQIAIIKLEVTGENRKYRLMQDDMFGQTKYADLKYIPFEAKKFGKGSYQLEISTKLEPGEYAICYRHASDVLNCFGID